MADDGTVTPPVDPATITDPAQRAVAQYEGAYDNFSTSPFVDNPRLPTVLVQRAMRAFEQIDENAAQVLRTVVAAASSIVVDTTNVALHSNVDASPKGIDSLLALFGDPLKDVGDNVKDDPGEIEAMKKQLEDLNLAKELSTTEMDDLGKLLQGSKDQSLARLGDLLAEHPGVEQLQEFLEKEGTKGFVGISVLLNYLQYKESAPTAAAVIESLATVAISGVSATAAGAGTAAQYKAWENFNEQVFDTGADGNSLDAPDPLNLGPSAIDAASGQ